MLKDKKGFNNLTAAEKLAYANFLLLDSGVWQRWSEGQQKEFWSQLQKQNIPIPKPKPYDLGKDRRGREIGSYTPAEYEEYERKQTQLRWLYRKSDRWREIHHEGAEFFQHIETEEDIEVERKRRKEIGQLRGKAMGKYEEDPVWDDVVPIPQDDGEGALAQIAYSDEYAEGNFTFLRCVKMFS